MIKNSLLTALCIALCSLAGAQATYEAPDADALENIYVERYYVADETDACDTDGGSLPEGAVTYRVFVDLKEGYQLETIFGNAHVLRIGTTTSFFNNEDRGEITGDGISINNLNDNTVALDSYLAMGLAIGGYAGIPKLLDEDGSLIGGELNDGGSCADEGGLLSSENELACEPVIENDGLIPSDLGDIVLVGLNNNDMQTENTVHMFGETNSSDNFVVTDGAWAYFGGLQGPTPDNMIFIGQFTTDGEFTFDLNMRIAIPEDLQCDSVICPTVLDYYSEILESDTAGQPDYIKDAIISSPSLSFNSSEAEFVCATSTEENFLAGVLNVGPNPTSDLVTVTITDPSVERLSLDIVDLRGRRLSTHTLGSGRSTIDVRSIPSGVYLLEFSSLDGATFVQRLIIE